MRRFTVRKACSGENAKHVARQPFTSVEEIYMCVCWIMFADILFRIVALIFMSIVAFLGLSLCTVFICLSMTIIFVS